MFLTTVEGVFVDYHAKDVSQLYAHPSVFLGRNIKDVMPAPVSELLLQAAARVRTAEEPEKVEYALSIDGAERFYEARVVGCDGDKILSIVRNVTEQKTAQMEAAAQRLELAHLSRVAVLGELTGALAHELTQPLTAVLSNAQAARAFMDREPIDVLGSTSRHRRHHQRQQTGRRGHRTAARVPAEASLRASAGQLERCGSRSRRSRTQ